MTERYGAIATYIMGSGRNGTLYIGVTSDLHLRVLQHKQKLIPGFSARYGCKRLVLWEPHDSMASAIRREKQLKHWLRAWKLALIESVNPDWRDLSEDWWEETTWDHQGLNG